MVSLWTRFYGDFLMPSRLPEYETLLSQALEQGYKTHSLRSFWEVSQVGLKPGQKCLILRRDVDTDAATARAMWAIEQKLGVRSSSYFRLSTVDVRLMQEIESSGSEASYHYEEIATMAKRHGLCSKESILPRMTEIRSMFAQNLMELRRRTGLPMVTVASHGDFVNRAIGMYNWELMSDELRSDLGIWAEAYDHAINHWVTARFSDTLYPEYWKKTSPFSSVVAGESVILILTHPRHWRVARFENIKDNLLRVVEGLQYRRARFRNST